MDRGFDCSLSPFPRQGMPLPLPASPVLLLPEVGPEDQGTYSCVATHPSHRPQESRAVSISITGEKTSLQIPGTLRDSAGSSSLLHSGTVPRGHPTLPSVQPHPGLLCLTQTVTRERPGLSPLL